MTVTLHLVRHAQGYHNLSRANEKISDPNLTDEGRAQCATLRATFPHHQKLTHRVASPMRRTLETCLHGFGEGSGPKVMAMQEVQEISILPCDVGSGVDVLREEYGDRVDFTGVEKGWRDKGPASRWEPTVRKLETRALAARRALRDLGRESGGDAHVVVVTHGGFLHFLTDDWHGIPDQRARWKHFFTDIEMVVEATGWQNTEFRSYQFVDPTGEDPNAAIQETEDSWNRRHGEKIPPTLGEKEELKMVKQRELAPLLNFSL